MKPCPKCSYPNPDNRASCLKCSANLSQPATGTIVPNQPPGVDQCKNCGAPPERTGYILPLCTKCRDTLVRRPFPPAVFMSMAVVAAAVVFALMEFPSSIDAAVAFERGRRAESASNYREAVQEYRRVLNTFPDSTEPTARLGISYYRSGDIPAAIRTINLLEGRKVSKELVAELDATVREIESRMPAGNQESL